MRSNGQAILEDDPIELDDEKTLEELLEEQEKQKLRDEETEKSREELSVSGSQVRNRIDEILEDRADLEMKKIKKLYDEKVIIKLLRMLELFTSISLINKKVAEYVDKVMSDEFIVLLLKLLLT